MTTLKFDELNLSKELIKAIADLGFEESTPIQSQSIPLLMEGKDLIGQAQTGTGKTASFGIPIIEKIDPSIKSTQAIVLCPTRELAVQVAEGLNDLLKYKKDIRVVPIYGGQSIERQISALRKGVHIIIATPGRLIDHLERKTVSLDDVKTVVLDEADEMLNMGFIDDMEKILKRTPKERQTVFFSATMPEPILKLTKKYLKNPEHIKVVHKELTVPNIQQFYYEMKPDMKLEILTRLIDFHNPRLSLIFCNTKRAADKLVSHLKARGYSADALHGDLRQNQRDKVMAKFRAGKIDMLVATDVAARGIDVDDIDAVFNYDMPQDEEYYVHRIGRTARAGRVGQSHTFVTGKEFYKIKEIERYTKSKITRKELPTMEDVEDLRTEAFLGEIRTVIGDGSTLSKYNHYIEALINEDYTSFEVASALVKMLLHKNTTSDANQISQTDESFSKDSSKKKFKDKNQFRDKNKRKDKSRSGDKPWKDKPWKDKSWKDKPWKDEPRKDPRERKPEQGMVRLHINVGKKNSIAAKDIVGAFAGETGISSKSIGAIDIYDKFSFVDVESKHAAKVIRMMNDNQIKGKTIAVNEAKGK